MSPLSVALEQGHGMQGQGSPSSISDINPFVRNSAPVEHSPPAAHPGGESQPVESEVSERIHFVFNK